MTDEPGGASVPLSASIAGSYKTPRRLPASIADMGEILGLIGFAVVSSVTPGPNNVLLLAEGSTFGFRRTLPHVLGTALGIGLMAVAVGAGLGLVIATVPAAALAMRIVGSVYLLYLAVAIARSGGIATTTTARPLGVGRAAAFQLVNPKVWIFALGAMSTFRPAALPLAPGVALVAVTMMAVVLPTASLWAAGGGAFGRVVGDGRAARVVSVALAGIVALTVVSVWI
jgi:threonine/homoserine/homoserine lactone efflux protein